MIYTDDELIGLEKPPLIDGKFSPAVYYQWALVNKRHPWQMLYVDWRDMQSHLKLRDYGLYLTMLNHWFTRIECELEKGNVIEDIIYQDYLARTTR